MSPKGWCFSMVSVGMVTLHASWPKPGSHLNISMLIIVYCGFCFFYNLVLLACKWRHCSFTGEQNNRPCSNFLASLSTLCQKGIWSTIQFIPLFPRESSSYRGTCNRILWWEDYWETLPGRWSTDLMTLGSPGWSPRACDWLAELKQVTDCLWPQISHPSRRGLAGVDNN